LNGNRDSKEDGKDEKKKRHKNKRPGKGTDGDGQVPVEIERLSVPEGGIDPREEDSSTSRPSINPDRQKQIDDFTKHTTILSKFQRSTSIAEKLAKTSLADDPVTTETAEDEEPTELHGLEPLPQPVPVDQSTQLPAFSALPSWLAKPVTVSATDRIPFQEFKINSKLKRSLKAKGYVETFAVQSALLPMLLHGSTPRTGDVCVSAATGSGKTLAYVLPIIESLRSRVVTKLRALIVVPTRELVSQVREACELCLSGSGLQIETAVGNRPFKTEQGLFVKTGQIYDPQGYAMKYNRMVGSTDDGDLYDPVVDDILPDELLSLLPDHVFDYSSKIDILICTPGRLVDHIRSTPGFTLDDLQWLVIDEADRLFTMDILEREIEPSEARLDQRLLHVMNRQPIKSNVRKIVLSATMTKDVGKLSVLKLKRPTLVVVDHGASRQGDGEGDEADGPRTSTAEESFHLPAALLESAVSVRDEGEKPLYLHQLLRKHILEDTVMTDAQEDDDSSSSSESSEDDASSPFSPPSSGTESEDIEQDAKPASATESTHDRHPNLEAAPRGVLVFTKSNESAIRLARLLALMHPPYAPILGILTSTQPSSKRRRTLRSFLNGSLSLLIASDLVSRGMDMPNLAHVVNYDLPPSVRGYIHRVGRTARAGRAGHAWTMVTDKEARWFWRSIGRGQEIKRAEGQKVQRVNDVTTETFSEPERSAYEKALEALGQEVQGETQSNS
jgi:ATP-dependent RNA helicase DDX51/DBP6